MIELRTPNSQLRTEVEHSFAVFTGKLSITGRKFSSQQIDFRVEEYLRIAK